MCFCRFSFGVAACSSFFFFFFKFLALFAGNKYALDELTLRERVMEEECLICELLIFLWDGFDRCICFAAACGVCYSAQARLRGDSGKTSVLSYTHLLKEGII